jgi:hypothetical protein
MEKSEKRIKTQEGGSLGALVLTLVISNVLVFVYAAPYA